MERPPILADGPATLTRPPQAGVKASLSSRKVITMLDSHARVYAAIAAIPPGRVASYGAIAARAGLPGRARLVGRLLGEVPDGMELPWFRVLRSSGEIALPRGSRGFREIGRASW